MNAYLPPQKAGSPQAEYERRYARYADLPQPVIAGAELRFEIYPDAPAVDMRGSYRLVNQTGVPIRSVHVETPSGRDYEVRSMTFDRASKAEVRRSRSMATGSSRSSARWRRASRCSSPSTWRSARAASGTAAAQTMVVRNGSYFDRRLLPFIGYQPGFEVSGDAERKRYGLPPKPTMPGPGDAAARRYQSPFRDGDRMHVETIVGTAADQIAVVPGMLRRSWTENGRRYFHYGLAHPGDVRRVRVLGKVRGGERPVEGCRRSRSFITRRIARTSIG